MIGLINSGSDFLRDEDIDRENSRYRLLSSINKILLLDIITLAFCPSCIKR